tara:strand:- start:28760 stop:29149 length:390 start_codon:yes stop_codon:yes gene_type:complete
MNKINFYDVKTLLLVVFGVIIIGLLLFGNVIVDNNAKEIKALKIENADLMGKNDILKSNNNRLDKVLNKIDIDLKQNNKDTDAILTALDKINKKKNETRTYVNSLSANDVADELSKYLEKRTKGNDINN